MRLGLLALGLVAAAPMAATAAPRSTVETARLVLPTERYDHAVLGDGIEWGGLALTVGCVADCPAGRPVRTKLTVVLPQSRVFEDVTARVADLDGDGVAEVLVVETDLAKGASLAVYDATGQRRAATAFIGQRYRWLAPAGIADFDGDGRPEIAYVDRPHLARELVFVRLQGSRLVELARIKGLSNHRIGDRAISGGVRDCGHGPEAVLANADWTRIMAVRFTSLRPQARDIGPLRGSHPFEKALACSL